MPSLPLSADRRRCKRPSYCCCCCSPATAKKENIVRWRGKVTKSGSESGLSSFPHHFLVNHSRTFVCYWCSLVCLCGVVSVCKAVVHIQVIELPKHWERERGKVIFHRHIFTKGKAKSVAKSIGTSTQPFTSRIDSAQSGTLFFFLLPIFLLFLYDWNWNTKWGGTTDVDKFSAAVCVPNVIYTKLLLLLMLFCFWHPKHRNE